MSLADRVGTHVKNAGPQWDLGGLTLHVLVVWLLRKWRKKGEIEILGCYGFSLIWFLEGN